MALRSRQYLFRELDGFLLPHAHLLQEDGDNAALMWRLELQASDQAINDWTGINQEGMLNFSPEPTPDSHTTAIYKDPVGLILEKDEAFEILQEWHVTSRLVKIMYGKDCEDHALVQNIYATIRKLFFRELLLLGHAKIIHASAIAYQNKGILIIGNKGAGKSTLATALLQNGAFYMASDRTFLYHVGHHWCMAGWPCTYRLNEESLAMCFEEEVLANIHQYIEKKKGTENFVFNHKYRFIPGDLFALINAKAAAVAPLAMVIELIPDKGSAEWLLEEKSQMANKVLKEHFVPYELPPYLGPGLKMETEPMAMLPTLKVNSRINPQLLCDKIIHHIQNNN